MLSLVLPAEGASVGEFGRDKKQEGIYSGAHALEGIGRNMRFFSIYVVDISHTKGVPSNLISYHRYELRRLFLGLVISGTPHHQRQAERVVRENGAVVKLFEVLGPRYK